MFAKLGWLGSRDNCESWICVEVVIILVVVLSTGAGGLPVLIYEHYL